MSDREACISYNKTVVNIFYNQRELKNARINVFYLIWLFIIIIISSSSSKWCLSCLKRNISNRRDIQNHDHFLNH